MHIKNIIYAYLYIKKNYLADHNGSTELVRFKKGKQFNIIREIIMDTKLVYRVV